MAAKKMTQTKKNAVFAMPGNGRRVKCHRKARRGRNEVIRIPAKKEIQGKDPGLEALAKAYSYLYL
jgi:hypothetical protein